MTDESSKCAIDDDFDLDVRIDDLDVVDPDRIHRAQTYTGCGSCTDCCPTVYWGCTNPGCVVSVLPYCGSAQCN